MENYAAELGDLIVVNRINIAIAALNIADYAVTVRQEVDSMWRRRWTLATWIFFSNRYLAIIYSFDIVAILVAPSMARFVNWIICAALLDLLSVTLLLQFAVLALFSSLRVYALWNRCYKWPLLVLVLNLIPVATDIYNYSSISPRTPFEVFGCSSQARISKLNIFCRDFSVGLCNRICVILADGLVLIATWKKTFGPRRESIRLSLKLPTVNLLFRDGTMYFFASFLLNLAQFVTVMLSTFSSVSPISESSHWQALIPILISRFLLDLKNLTEEEMSPTETGVRSQLQWHYSTTIMGNLGASLRSPFDESDDDADSWGTQTTVYDSPRYEAPRYDYELQYMGDTTPIDQPTAGTSTLREPLDVS